MAEKLGIMICGHGSRNKMAADQFSTLATGLKKLMPEHPVEYGYLEFANPVTENFVFEDISIAPEPRPVPFRRRSSCAVCAACAAAKDATPLATQ